MAEPLPSPLETRRWLVPVVIAVASMVIGGVVGGVVVSSRDEQRTRQEEVADRGAVVMPFDLTATTHVFDTTDDGGIQTVVADDPEDRDQIRLIRSHLREEVARFEVGDFGDPEAVHGHQMPGLAVLDANADALTISYRDVSDGGEITYRSDDQVVVAALHDWFAAQVSDHDTHARGEVSQ